MKTGSWCTQDFVPLVAAENSWSLARVLTTHWNDEAANMLEKFAMSLAYEDCVYVLMRLLLVNWLLSQELLLM